MRQFLWRPALLISSVAITISGLIRRDVGRLCVHVAVKLIPIVAAMIIGFPTELGAGECRVAASPGSVKKLIKLGYEVRVQAGAGQKASLTDEHFREAGATVVPSATELFDQCDIIAKVEPPTDAEVGMMKENTRLLSFVWPAKNDSLTEKLRAKNITTLAMDCVPRISRAQKLDALSSMANIAGYRSIIESANEFGSFFTGQITAAGKVPPAKVLVIGAVI